MQSLTEWDSHRVGRALLISVFAALLIGFPSSSSLSAGQEGTNPGTPVPVTPLVAKTGPRWSFENNSGIGDRLRVVIRDNEAWRDLWKRIYKYSELPPLPEIDFSREMLVVVALGARPTGGYGIVVDGAYEKDGRLEIKVRSISPGKSCFVTQATTQPVDIVRVAKTERSVVFRESEVVHQCK